MSIRKVKTKFKGIRYQAICRIQGKQIKKTFDTPEEARLWEAEQLAGRGQRDPGTVEPEELTLHQLTAEWWYHYAEPDLSLSTQRKYHGLIEQHLMPYLGLFYCSELTVPLVQGWRQKLASTRESAPRLLRQILAWGQARGLVRYNPLGGVRLRGKAASSWTYLSQEEVRQFLDAERGQPEHFAWMVLLYMGLRRGEICALDQAHVRLDLSRLHVCQRWCDTERIIKKGTKGSRGGHLKSRWLPIPTILRPGFAGLLREPGPHLISNRVGGRLRPAALYTRFAAALEQSEVRHVRLHDLRHTYASHYMMNGGRLYELRDLMGHSSIQQTEKYAHLSPDYLQGSADVVQYGDGVRDVERLREV